MPLRVYNTLTRTKEPFQTVVPGKVGMYVCGPTVYSPSHIGHMVGPVIFDTIKRYLVYLGYEVTWVVNITDVDDKLIVQAQKDGTTVKELAERMTRDYLDCLAALGVDGIDHMPRATEHIDEIIEITAGLIDKGFAYPSEGDVYFDVDQAPEYGKLSHRDPESCSAGAGSSPPALSGIPATSPSGKLEARRAVVGQPLGTGRPGWHIECSAMSMKLARRALRHPRRRPRPGLSRTTKTRWSSPSRTPASRSPRTGCTTACLTKDGKKISKSDPGTIVLMSDLLKAHDPDTLRALLLVQPLSPADRLRPDRLDEIERGLQTFYRAFERFEELTGTAFDQLDAPTRRAEFDPATRPCSRRSPSTASSSSTRWTTTSTPAGPSASCSRSSSAESIRQRRDAERHRALAEYRAGMVVLKELSQILGLFRRPPARPEAAGDGLTAPLLDLLIELRARLRKEKNFALADEIRKRLADLGVMLEDRPDGTRWRIEPRRQTATASSPGSKERSTGWPADHANPSPSSSRAEPAARAPRRRPGRGDRPRPERDRLRGGRAVAARARSWSRRA